MYKVGDLVTRNSYSNDIVFKIIRIEDNIYYLKGISVRLYADSKEEDLKIYKEEVKKEDEILLDRIKSNFKMERNDFFYLPGKILHIDGDSEYLEECLNYYKKVGLLAVGKVVKEEDIENHISEWIEEYMPSIVVITGHDAYYSKKGDKKDLNNYKNSMNFIKAIKKARDIEKSHDKLIIIAGACQSNYEELIKAGANFASSPKRINIHALDPAVIASYMALFDSSKDIDLIKVLENTKYGSNGMGGIKTKGTMYIGYPR